MNRGTQWSRRNLLAGSVAAGIGLVAGPTLNAEPVLKKVDGEPFKGLKVGVATYTLGKLCKTTEEAIKAIKRVGVSYCSIKDFHLSFKTTAEERKAAAAKFKEAGITPLSVGNITLKNDEAQLREMFQYAKDVGVSVMVCAPAKDALPLCEKMVKEFDIKMAIHNHGPEDKNFPSPYDVMAAAQNMDPRIGCCIDVGHTARAGVDPTESILKIGPRVYDIHMKDLERIDRRSIPIECGRGVLDIKAMLAALLKINFQGHVGFEHEKDMADVLPGLAEDVGYVRGVLA